MVDGIIYKDGSAQVYVSCVKCHAQKVLHVPAEPFKAWQRHELKIQDALPMLSADDRELLISGLCPDCWNKLFSEV